MEHDAQPLAHSAAPAAVRHERNETRRRNLIMLTAARGAKIALTHAAKLTSSRVSLMTSGRKPVSDPFAQAIEQALGLPPGWLDAPQARQSVPQSVWSVLGTSASTAPDANVDAEPRTPAGGQAGTDIAALLAQAAAAPTALFDKPRATVGPIAEALARTILNMSRADKLSERKAFQLLGALLNDDT
ncbi:hypothetical protein [Aromatoleum petrolei]|uniref:Uncharacterized protein n=1 Tax=Aromatoleum petrolei TaxID=76116 RepID=A0ABX1MVJ2_9RHOO|nr:hypothetical protein [Aromatoleum petrolei]NMF91270.1 hypothetical protein [Aromatoleum petrolei]QTQ37059.1 Uncharacterized protein ToN1_29290 [Aromatoleum petrolei]